jgi:sporulation inhibitor KapD
MKKRIWSVDAELKVFYLIIDGKKTGFYLSNRLYKTFMPYLMPGTMVDFTIFEKRKRIKRRWTYQVAFFNQIIQIHPYRVWYDINQMRNDMKHVLSQENHFLFIDFEMTMPGYRETDFKSEIIQVGYVLSKSDGPILLEDGFYVMPKEKTYLSKRTIKFLNLDTESFFDQAITFHEFYDKLKSIVDTYQPKLVVWGKNDAQALEDAYVLHQKNRLIKNTDFIDLLKLHKDYYNLKDDLGLFKAYKTYYQADEHQAHDAAHDARITKMVFDAFIKKMA